MTCSMPTHPSKTSLLASIYYIFLFPPHTDTHEWWSGLLTAIDNWWIPFIYTTANYPGCSDGPPRFSSLRAKHVHAVATNPKSRPRHESVNVDLYTQKKESNYLDVFQEHGAGRGGMFGSARLFQGSPRTQHQTNLFVRYMVHDMCRLEAGYLFVCHCLSCNICRFTDRREPGCLSQSTGRPTLLQTSRKRRRPWRKRNIGSPKNLGQASITIYLYPCLILINC